MDLTFEKATAADLDAIMRNVEDAKHRGTCDWDDEYPDREIIAADIASGGTYVLRGDEGVAASICMHAKDEETHELESAPGIAWTATDAPCGLSRLCVRPELQNAGLGRRMMQSVMAEAKARGLTGIRLLASVDNPAANSLYIRLGCNRLGETRLYDWPFIAYEKLL